MSESVLQGMGCIAIGAMMGGLFYGGLWFSVLQLATHARPVALMFVSALLRFTIVLAGFYMLTTWEASSALFALAGFILARILIARRVANNRQSETHG